MEKTGFIYLWFDHKHKRFYLGSHLGTEDDGYICSSKWMKQSYKRRPDDFKRRILRKNIKKSILKEEESKWLNLIKNEELGKKYYNLSKIMNGNGWEKDKPRSEKTKTKISKSLKSRYEKDYSPWNKGKTDVYSEETKKRISINVKKALNSLPKCDQEKMEASYFKIGQTPWNKGNSDHSKNIWKNNPNSGTSKKYLIIFSDGRKEEIINLAKYCRDNKLSKTQIYKCMKTKTPYKEMYIERIL